MQVFLPVGCGTSKNRKRFQAGLRQTASRETNVLAMIAVTTPISRSYSSSPAVNAAKEKADFNVSQLFLY
jgi:hypothetical protein